MKYRKKPVVIEAFKWDGIDLQALMMWAASADLASKRARGVAPPPPPPPPAVTLPIDVVTLERGYRVEIHTKEGTMVAAPGDYIICGVQGEFYPCKPDIFEATYEAGWLAWVHCAEVARKAHYESLVVRNASDVPVDRPGGGTPATGG